MRFNALKLTTERLKTLFIRVFLFRVFRMFCGPHRHPRIKPGWKSPLNAVPEC